MTSNPRLYYIDNLKGLLILLVILGHCVQFTVADFDHHPIFRFIYSFHMPLFMAVSGYVSYKSVLKWESVGKRFWQLIIPFFAWLILASIRVGDINHFYKGLLGPDTGLWFLWVLFFISIIIKLCDLLSSHSKVTLEWTIALICILMLGAVIMFKFKMFGSQLIAWYFAFYSIGFFMRKYEKSGKAIPLALSLAMGLVFISLMPFWMRKDPPTFLNVSSASIVVVSNYAYKFIVAIAAILFIIPLAKYSLNRNILVINKLGGATLGLYAIHQPLLGLLISLTVSLELVQLGGWQTIIGLFIVTTVISFGVYLLLGQWNVAAALFLGKHKNKI